MVIKIYLNLPKNSHQKSAKCNDFIKNREKSQKKFGTNEKIPTFAIPNKKGTQIFEVYFWMDTRHLDDEGGSYLLVMTD